MSTSGRAGSERSRDFVGYGDNPPRVEWPGSARMALNIVVNVEEGSEPNPLLGDGRREIRHAEAQYLVPESERELIQESNYEYGSRVGHWRVIDLFDTYEVTCSIFAAGMALEVNPALAQAFASRNYDLVGHGYRWVGHYGMSEAEEREDIRRCVESIRSTTGQTITGWWNRPPVTLDTRRLLASEGFLYDSTAVNDDIPYYESVDGRPMLIVPYSLDTNDTRFWKGAFVLGNDFFAYLRDAFDVLYKESARVPRMMSVGLHGRIIGRPGRINGLSQFLEHVKSHPDVWVTGRSAIARVWAEQFAPKDAWNWKESVRA